MRDRKVEYFLSTSAGLLAGFSPDKILWERLMEEFARLTFPNGRTGAMCGRRFCDLAAAITQIGGQRSCS